MSYGLDFTGYSSILEGFSVSNWISDSLDIKSIIGYVFLMGGSAILWQSTKQTIVAKSTIEVELIGLHTTYVEAEWLKELLFDISLIYQLISSILINCDSREAIYFCKKKLINSKLSRRLKRIQKSIK
jgi:multisubunit Na+/H+ antiporter MnhF subunit